MRLDLLGLVKGLYLSSSCNGASEGAAFMAHLKTVLAFLLAAALTAHAQNASQPKAAQRDSGQAPAEDISGMYSFLNDGEFLQINLEADGVSGYVSRRGDLESDRGAFLDQFFSKASVHGHD
jgi:hypothetical protein